MAKPRLVDPVGYYHLNSTGNFGRTLYEEEVHRQVFLRLYERIALKLGWKTLVYCLMTNHYHVVLQLTDGGLSKGMQLLNGGFSRRMNAIYGRTGKGHLFKNRFHGDPIEDDAHLLETCRYVPLNPVRAGLCELPEDWPWSSFGPCIGRGYVPRFLAVDELLALFDPRPDVARKAYKAFVHDGHVRWSDQRKGFVRDAAAA
jgi:REP element-mobilizing transposase RayT